MNISRLILMAALAAWSFAAAAAEKKKTNPVSESKGGRLTLADALARTFRRSPELAAFAHDERATEARVLQAGIRPNPEASLNVENFAGTRGRGPGRYRGDARIQPAHRTRRQTRRASDDAQKDSRIAHKGPVNIRKRIHSDCHVTVQLPKTK